MSQASSSAAVEVTIEGRVARLEIERPPLNILDLATLAELARAAERLVAEPDLQVVLVRGRGGRAFSAGVAIEDHTRDKIPAMLATFHGALRHLDALAAITVAVVDGHCLGGGMELAAVCDLVIASEHSSFGQPEIKVGCYPPVAAALYPARLGHGRTCDLLLTGRTLSCAEAERLGFVTRKAGDATFDSEVAALVAELTAHSATVARLTKKAIRASRGPSFVQALAACEQIYLEELAKTEDVEEGVRAFLDKRPPAWRHR